MNIARPHGLAAAPIHAGIRRSTVARFRDTVAADTSLRPRAPPAPLRPTCTPTLPDPSAPRTPPAVPEGEPLPTQPPARTLASIAFPASAPTAPAPPTDCRAWAAATPDAPLHHYTEHDDLYFSIPALRSRADLAVCIAGSGGLRGAALGLGWARALHALGVLHRARYLSTTSCSSWLAAALCFQRTAPTSDFLGPYLPPGQCSVSALGDVGSKGSSFAACLADAAPLRRFVWEQLAWNQGRSAAEARQWMEAVSGSFLQPYGLGGDGSTVAAEGTEGNVHMRAEQRCRQQGTALHTARAELPFPIIGQSVLLPRNPEPHHPFEWTPLYSGSPLPAPAHAPSDPRVAAGWVETAALGSELVRKPLAASPTGCTVGVRPPAPADASSPHRPAPPAVSSLAGAVAASSCSLPRAYAASKAGHPGRLLHQVVGQGARTALFDPRDGSSRQVELTDGGGCDALALYPVLRRRVAHVVMLVPSDVPLEVSPTEYARRNKDLAALFGRWTEGPSDAPSGPDASAFNARRQVFPAHAFDDLLAALRAKHAAGQPAVHTASYSLLPNAHVGVEGGWAVRVMWAVNAQQRNWEEALPAETRRELYCDRALAAVGLQDPTSSMDADSLHAFPHTPAHAVCLSPELVGLLSNHAAHMLLESREELMRLLAAAEEGAEAEEL